MSTNASKRSLSGRQGTDLAVPAEHRPGTNGHQGSLDCVTALEDGRDLGRRDARASSVRQSEVRLRERCRGVPDLEAPGLEVTNHHRQRMRDADVVS